MMNYFIYPVSKKQCTETGLAMILIALISNMILDRQIFQVISIGLAAAVILFPMVLYPLAVVWFGFAKLLGGMSSKVLLCLIFFLIVTPVALIRRIAGKDSLSLRDFKNGKATAFTIRSHKYLPEDLAKPF